MEIKFIFKKAGGVKKLAHDLGYKAHGHLCRWKHVPSQHLIKVEELTGIPREVLRPELYIRQPRPDGDAPLLGHKSLLSSSTEE